VAHVAGKCRGPGSHLVWAAAAGLLAALLVWFQYHFSAGDYSDIDQIWYGARALLAGQNPYETTPTQFPWPLYYPLPALLIGLPLAPLTLMAARCVFAFATVSLCTWALLRYHRPALLLLASGPFLYAVQRGQWAPLVLTACLIPAWSVVVLSAKPSVGLGPLLYRPTRLAVLGTASLFLVSLFVLPRWPLDWADAMAGQRHLRIPLLLPGGFLLGLAILRWKTPEARLLLMLAAVPQTVGLYELVPLAVVPKSRRESLLVVVAWMGAYLIRVAFNPLPLIGYAHIEPNYSPPRWWAILLLGYLPILILILRRPNVAEHRD
jgi:hypothetical protein